MSKVTPTRRAQTNIDSRLSIVEQLLDKKPLTIEGLRLVLRADALGRRVCGPANRNGTILYYTRKTPAEEIETAVAAIEARPVNYEGGNITGIPAERRLGPKEGARS